MFNIDLSFFLSFGVGVEKLETLVLHYFDNDLISSNKFDYFLQIKLKNKKNINIYYTGRLLFQGNFQQEEVLKLVKYLLDTTNVCNFDVCIGSDEAGKGEVRGGMSVVAFAIKRENLANLIVLGVADSKRLQSQKLEALVDKVENLGWAFVELIEAEAFNAKWKQAGNLNKLLEQMHTSVLNYALKSIFKEWVNAKKYAIFVDKFTSRQSRIKSRLDIPQNSGIIVEYYEEHKAEKYPVVGAASIIAKSVYGNLLKTDKGYKDYKSVS